jgi:hypothetical protein
MKYLSDFCIKKLLEYPILIKLCYFYVLFVKSEDNIYLYNKEEAFFLIQSA